MKNSEFLIWRQRRCQDRFRIKYECHQLPSFGVGSGVFRVGETYHGRCYNGLYQVSADWGREEAHQLEKSEFERYFRLIKQPTTVLGT